MGGLLLDDVRLSEEGVACLLRQSKMDRMGRGKPCEECGRVFGCKARWAESFVDTPGWELAFSLSVFGSVLAVLAHVRFAG